MPKIVLHHLVNSRSERLFVILVIGQNIVDVPEVKIPTDLTVWALEALGLPYEVQVHQRTAQSRAPASYGGSTGKAPAIEIDSETLSESGYILSRLTKLARSLTQSESHTDTGTDTEIQAELEPSNSSEYYTHYAEGTFMLWAQAQTLVWISTRNTAPMGLEAGGEGDKAVKGYADWACERLLEPETQGHLDQLEAHLSQNDWFSGTDKPGTGDFMLLYPLVNMLDETRPKAPWQRKTNYRYGDNLKKWLKRVQSHPAYQRGLERQRNEEAAASSKL